MPTAIAEMAATRPAARASADGPAPRPDATRGWIDSMNAHAPRAMARTGRTDSMGMNRIMPARADTGFGTLDASRPHSAIRPDNGGEAVYELAEFSLGAHGDRTETVRLSGASVFGVLTIDFVITASGSTVIGTGMSALNGPTDVELLEELHGLQVSRAG